MSDRKTGYAPLNAENNRGVANDVMFAYVHEKKNEHSVFCFEHFFFLFYDCNLNTHV